MRAIITPQPLSGTVHAISAKSDVHRLLLAAALADAPTQIVCNVLSADIRATANALSALGAAVRISDTGIFVMPHTEKPPQTVTVDCGESGSTLRFLLPVVSACGKNGIFCGAGRLPQRPLDDLRQAMEAHGVTFSPAGEFPVHTKGRLTAGRYCLSGNVSSQYITGLLFALPLLSGDSEIVLQTRLASKPYVDMTLHTLRQFGVAVEPTESGYFISGGQRFHSPKKITAQGDWSNAAFFLTAGAIGGAVTVTGLQTDSPQGDRAVLSILARMGARVSAQADAVTISAAPLCGTQIDATDIPDLVPILSVAAAFAQEGRTTVTNAARLRLKESDRLAAICTLLTRLGAKAEETADGLSIEGGGLHGGAVSGFHDHRIVMSAAVGAAFAATKTEIFGSEAVEKSYPQFFTDFKHLGGKADVLSFDR